MFGSDVHSVSKTSGLRAEIFRTSSGNLIVRLSPHSGFERLRQKKKTISSGNWGSFLESLATIILGCKTTHVAVLFGGQTTDRIGGCTDPCQSNSCIRFCEPEHRSGSTNRSSQPFIRTWHRQKYRIDIENTSKDKIWKLQNIIQQNIEYAKHWWTENRKQNMGIAKHRTANIWCAKNTNVTKHRRQIIKVAKYWKQNVGKAK